MDTLQIMITNDRTGGERTRNFYYEVKVDRKIAIEGIIKGIPRIEKWIDRLRELMIDQSGNKVIIPTPVPSYNPASIPLEKQQDRYLSDKEVSKITGIRVGTLRNNRYQRKGIPYVKLTSKMCRYKLSDVLAYMEQNRIGIDRPGRRK